ncbi:MAG: hypothetical protein JNK82_20650 [Myxococcaceae bacterium]|nr:hypothetical protein [Myxococcaceae bacterium]
MADLKLIVGNRNTSGESLPPYLALSHIGQPFERELAEPGALVPALDGVIGAREVCEHLAERFPAAQLWPKFEDARQDALALLKAPWPALQSQLPFLFLAKKTMPKLSADAARELSALDAVWRRTREKYEGVGPWLLGEFSLADCMAAPLASRALTWGLPLDAAYVQTVFSLPAMKRWGEAAALDAAGR